MTVENNHRWPAPNHNYVPEFQMSGIPFVGTYRIANLNQNYNMQKVSFDQVTRWIQIINHVDNGNTHIFLFFNETEANSFLTSANGGNTEILVGTAGGYHIRIDKSTPTQRYELKCKELYIIGKTATGNGGGALGDMFSVIAGLTNVPSNTFPDQTKLNGFTGVQS